MIMMVIKHFNISVNETRFTVFLYLLTFLFICVLMMSTFFFSIELKHFLVTRIICGGDHSFLLYSNEQVCVYG